MGSLTADAQGAWEASLLGRFSDRATRALVDRAVLRRYATGAIIHRGSGDTMSPIFLIVDGLVRIYVTSDGGREMTVRYAASGELVGLPALAAGRSNPGVAVQVMIDTECVSLPASTLATLAATDVSVAWPIAGYVAETLHLSEQLWSNNLFQRMQPRVAYHLLELSVRDDGGLVVHASQDQVANAVGSVREVVARTLREFAQAGLIERGNRAIRLLDPPGLHRTASQQND